MTISIGTILVDGKVVWSNGEIQPAWLELGTWKEETRIKNNIRVAGYAQAIGGGDLNVDVVISGYCGLGTEITDIYGGEARVTDVIRGVEPGNWYYFDVNIDTYVKNSDPEMLLKVAGNIGDGSVRLKGDVGWYDPWKMWLVPYHVTSEWIRFAEGTAKGFVRLKDPASDNWIYVRSLVNDTEVDKEKAYYGMDYDILLEAEGDFELQICERATSGTYLGFKDIQIIEENVVTGILSIQARNGHSFETTTESVSTRGYFNGWFGGARWKVPPPEEVTCDEPTEHFNSGCDLLLHYDTNRDGIIDYDEAVNAIQDYYDDKITKAEVDFVVAARDAGSINAICPDCFVVAPPPEPNIKVTNVRVVYTGKNTEITSWREDEKVEILVDLENTGGTGVATVEIYYNGTILETYDSAVPGGGSATDRRGPFTIPAGSWSLCAEVVSQVGV